MAGEQGRAFPAFPYSPYEIQSKLMTAMYDTLQHGGIGIFQSPTGTGKTLSTICSALQWLLDHQHASELDSTASKPDPPSEGGAEEPDWLRDFTVEEEQRKLKERRDRLAQVRKRAAQEKAKEHPAVKSLAGEEARTSASTGTGSRQQEAGRLGTAEAGEEEFLVDWTSDSEERVASAANQGKTRRRPSDDEADMSSDSESQVSSEEDPCTDSMQLIFCSRTHSQLSQFLGELQRAKFQDSLRVVALGGRKQLCINPQVSGLTSTNLNQACLDLQKQRSAKRQQSQSQSSTLAGGKPKRASSKSKGGCPYLRKKGRSQSQFKAAMLEAPMDIEELARQGRRRECCAYYTARRAQVEADVITMPYTSLVHREVREGLGVRVRGNAVIIDEAHNLIDTISAAHSVQLAGAHVLATKAALQSYLGRFRWALQRPGRLRELRGVPSTSHM
ncbi:hypothetical protein CYMTET_22625 [Cymbomonas tetramitiformis]|uniref:Helicase ATP-binding domain-containing protein n=1 Tax=Cymbomonas tetramitiformis TaxID=36881 RepID=A0AAE0G012_9CHLO|nr:hypothetical protein CYMTET_22625 [Cymbomonas tetramitiformis]